MELPLDRDDVTAILTGLFNANAKLDGDKFLPITPKEAQAGYEKHPKVRKMLSQ